MNKLTGIVRGPQYEKGNFVVLSDEEILAEDIDAVQAVDVVAFMDAGQLQPACFEMPYFLAPAMRGKKTYAILRKTLMRNWRDRG